MKRVIALMVILVMATALFVGCQAQDNQAEEAATSEAAEATVSDEAATSDMTAELPVLDVAEVYGKGPNGEIGSSYLDLSLSDEDVQKLADGNYKVAICMHMMSNAVNFTKVQVMQSEFEKYGVEVVSVSDADMNAATMTSNIEAAIALNPDLIIACLPDAIANKPACEAAEAAGIKMMFFELPPSGWIAGEDYVALESPDYYGNGRFAAEYMAALLNYEGTVGIAWADIDYWTCTLRDQAFREVMDKYPGIEVVADEGFAEVSLAGTVADGIFARFPEIDGMYSTWDDPAEQVCASARAAGRNDLIVTTVDLGDNTARVIAEHGMIKAVGSPRAYEDGLAISITACYALIEKELPSPFIATPTIGVDSTNVLEAYKIVTGSEPPQELVDAWNENNK